MTRRLARHGVMAVGLVLGMTGAAAAQATTDGRPAPVVEGSIGWAGFGDEGVVHHALVGAGARVYVSPRVSIGPELQYMVGPGSDRDLILTGNVVFDLLAPTAARPRRTTPFLVAGGGLFRHSDRFATGTFSTTEGAFTVGVGVRTWLSDRVYAALDARAGWEPHLRLAASFGVVPGR
ncbi:MAG: hypothetical protein AB7U83_12800 [Vicinamibacterales bacterium]